MTEQNTVSSLPLFDVPQPVVGAPSLWLKSEEPDPKTQCGQVLAYLREFGSITRLEGLRDLGIINIPGRILELKDMGYPIEKDTITVQNRWGKDCHVARYTLRKQE